MFNFHEIKMQEDKTRAFQEESRAARIDEMANDLYNEKLRALPNGRYGGTQYQARAGYNIWSTIDDIDQADLIPVARAIISNDAALVGMWIIELVTAQLSKDAKREAEDFDEENFSERKYGAA